MVDRALSLNDLYTALQGMENRRASDIDGLPVEFYKSFCLFNCSITEEGCAALVSALKSNPSHLRELDLRLNKPGESGVKLLSDLLEDPHCKLEKL
ncbi:hypothetical protein NFI96_021567, partial [Prochilodus magdalenae]